MREECVSWDPKSKNQPFKARGGEGRTVCAAQAQSSKEGEPLVQRAGGNGELSIWDSILLENAEGTGRSGVLVQGRITKVLVYRFFKRVFATTHSKKYISCHKSGQAYVYDTTATNNTHPYHAPSTLVLVYSVFFQCRLRHEKLISQPSTESPHPLVNHFMELGLSPQSQYEAIGGL